MVAGCVGSAIALKESYDLFPRAVLLASPLILATGVIGSSVSAELFRRGVGRLGSGAISYLEKVDEQIFNRLEYIR